MDNKESLNQVLNMNSHVKETTPAHTLPRGKIIVPRRTSPGVWPRRYSALRKSPIQAKASTHDTDYEEIVTLTVSGEPTS